MHGGHQVPQKFSTTTLPCKSERCVGLPLSCIGKSSARFPAMDASPCR